MPRKVLRIERIAPPADQHVGEDGEPLRPRRWGQLGYLVVGAARDLRRNRLTTSATLLLLSLSLALYGAVLLASEQLQLVASFVTGTQSDPRALADPRVQFLQMLRFLRWSASILAPAVGVAALVTLIAKVRMVAAARRDEARIMRLVGAGVAFVAGSLILQEVIIGLLSALLSLGLLAAGLVGLGRLHDLLPSALQGLQWVGTDQLLMVAPRLLVLGVLGGLIGATLALAIYR
jgi:cell division protein FtsX